MLPAVRLYLNPNDMPTQPCAATNRHKNPRLVRATFGPVYCYAHGDAINPTVGWAYITKEEADLLTIMRAHDWTREGLAEVVRRAEEERMDALATETAVMAIANGPADLTTPNDSGEEF